MAKRTDYEELYKVIEESSMDHWYLRHGKFFVNHLAHAQVGHIKKCKLLSRFKTGAQLAIRSQESTILVHQFFTLKCIKTM